MRYEDLTTDELLDALPQHLHVAKNDFADPADKWRIFNTVTEQYIAPGYETARQLLISSLTKIEREQKKNSTLKVVK